jgi:hypothetical protein
MEQQYQQQEKKVTLSITVNELNAVLQGLTEVKLGASIAAWVSINKQAEEQLGKPGAQGPLSDKLMN